MVRGFSARASLAAALFVTSALSATSASATSASAETLRAFDVPAQPLAAALNSFARQAGVQIFFPSESIAGRRSPTLKGRMAPRAALHVLLAGSGLTVASDDGHTVMLKVGGNDLTPAATSATASTSSAVERAVDTVLAGQVSQAGDGAHLNGVIVKIGTSGQTGGQTGVTDEQGRYRFANIKPGTYQVSFDYIGYPTMVQTVVLTSEVATRDVVLGDEAGTILVVGQRAAQAKALSEQRAADNVRNVVSADQAGRFPDFNAAESLRRVPGVSVQREVDAGEGRYISIRGLDSGLNNTQINGMNAAQPEKESRKVPLDMVQTSALSSITVHKTLLPDQDADGIGGAVVLETATAFDYKKRVIDLTVSGFYHDLANKFSPMVQGTLATKFGANDRFGILVSGGYSKRKTRGYVLYQDEDYLRLDENDASKGVTPLEFHTARYDNDRETISGNVAFNWAASDATQLVFKGSYNRLYDKELSRAIYYEGGTEDYDNAGKLILTQPGSVNIFDEYEETKLTQQSYVLNGTTNTGAFKLDYGVGYSTGERDEPFDNEVGFTKELQSNLFGYDYGGRFPIPNLTAADKAAIGDPNGYTLGYNDIDLDRSKNTRYAAHFDASYEPSASWLRLVKAGFKAERSNRKVFEANVMELSGPLTLSQFGTGGLVNPGKVGMPYAPYLSLNIDNLKKWRAYSQHLVDTNPAFSNEYVEDGSIQQDEDSYSSNEDIFAGYVMAKGGWGKWDVIGGLRADHTRVSSDNFEVVALEDADAFFTKVTGKAHYTSILPRLQVNYRASDNFVLRGAFYTSIARPEPQYISGATEIEEEDGKVDITVGNPGMKPAYAYNFDLSFERYFGSIGIVSAGVYYKKINRFIFSGTAPETEGSAAQFANDPRLIGKIIDDVTTYTNGKSADIYGVEFNIVRQFPRLPGALGGLGIYANVTLQRSKADTGIEGVAKDDFFNAPETILNGAVTYQKYGIEGSLAYSWRDSQAIGFSNYDTRIVEQSYGSLDGQIRYALTPRVKMFVSGVDILNSGKDPVVDQRYGKGSPYLVSTTYTGRTITFGINVSM